ncbi:hypothetical protein [Mesorhizobium sp.]|uniref:hypothetical protein n=1 Tax=Mesorhizobium sp. TaxID=1871066 RepID=UPI000FEA7CC9|nr:hypothetical protein [Mesorhizobium sp.]RWM25177.1 MAG: hypothetical protein EOR74_20995 [Mesorhizobium sp.]
MADKPQDERVVSALEKALAERAATKRNEREATQRLRRLVVLHKIYNQLADERLARFIAHGRFDEGADPPTRKSRPVQCTRTPDGRQGSFEVSRTEIALLVFYGLKAGPNPPLDDAEEVSRALTMRDLAGAVRAAAVIYGITEKQARDCFNDYRHELLSHAAHELYEKGGDTG